MAKKSEKIKIGHITYIIKTKKDLIKDGVACMGYIDYESNEILLNKNVGNRYWDTIFHEITHGIYEFTGKTLPEEQVERIANMWLMVLVENKWLMRKLLKEKRDARGGK
jgi:hypothetical protein